MTKQKLIQKQHQKLSPNQIQFLGLLQTPIISLEKRIKEEIEKNPVIDEADEADEADEETKQEGGFLSPNYYNYKRKKNYEDINGETSETLKQHLLNQLVVLDLDENSLFLVNYIINSLDDNGYLNRDLYSISSDLLTNHSFNASEKKLGVALSIVKNLDPCGVGSKNLKECLLLQLNKYHKKNKLAIKVIKDYYDKFSNKSYEFLIKNLDITDKKLKEIYTLVEKLNPIPSAGFSKNNLKSVEYIHPDFIITVANNKLLLQVQENETKHLKINKYYSKLVKETSDIKTKEFLKEKIDGAKWFIEAIEKRKTTLQKVMNSIIDIQKKYFLSGDENDLVPMKLADVANIVKMDISTISRVSNSKYVETFFGTFKVKELFSEAYRKEDGKTISTKKIIALLKNIIDSEDKTKPFTDEELSEILSKNKFNIARRTVSKYRDHLNIKIAKLRRVL